MTSRFFPRLQSARKSLRRFATTFSSRAELLEERAMLAGDVLQNPLNFYDVNGDGYVSPRDAAAIVWRLATSRGHSEARAQAAGESNTGDTPETMFYDVTGDGVLGQSDFQSVVAELNASGEPGDVVTFNIITTDLSGTPISTIEVGEEFILRVTTQDTQDIPTPPGGFGVFAGFLDVEFDSSLASLAGSLEFGESYSNQQQGDTSVAGIIDEVGAFANLTPLGTDEIELFSVRMQADLPGTLTITSNPADGGAAVDVLVYGLNDPVDTGDILYDVTSLQITGFQEAAPDLVGFANALQAAGVELWTTTLDARGDVAQQLDLFEEGQHFLPIMELLEKTPGDEEVLRATQEATDAGRSEQNIWVFPDSTESTGELLSLEEISQRSGVAIPMGASPSIAPIEDVTVLEGSPLHIPLDGYDPNGDDLTYTVSVGDPALLETFIPQDNRSIRFTNEEAGGYLGDTVFELYEGRAPRATDQIIALAEDGFYDGITYHRVVNEFVIQAGDPTGTGSGGSTLGDFDDQFHVDLQHNQVGVLSMAKTSDDTNDSQFFVTEVATRFLDFNHTIFGQLVEGERVRETISNVPRDSGDTPLTAVTLENVTVFEDNENAVVMLRALEATGSTTVTVTATDSVGNTSTQTFNVTLAEDTSNSQPFLEDFPDQVFQPGETPQFQVNAIDVEGDPIQYDAFIDSNEATIEIDENGLVTAGGFVGTLDALIRVSPENGVPSGAMDDQFFTITIVSDGPTGVDLLAITDSGASDTDDITNITELQFEVAGVSDGATVVLFSDGTEIGRGVATGETIEITTANPSALGSGDHAITAAIETDGVLSALSPALTVSLDQIPPSTIDNEAPTDATVGILYTFDASHEDEGTANATYSVTNAPTGLEIDESTGEVTWLPTGTQRGAQSFEIVVTDVAGNATSNPVSVDVVAPSDAVVSVSATDADGNPIAGVAVGAAFQIRVFVEDQRETPVGVGAAFVDVTIDDSLASFDSGIEVSPDFPNDVDTGTVAGGAVTGLGGSAASALGNGPRLLATIPMVANNVGVFSVDIQASSNGITFFGESSPIDAEDLMFTGTTINVLEVTAALTANDDVFTVDEDSGQTSLEVLNNDTLGPDSNIIAISSRTDPNDGGDASISADGRTILYTPADDYFGEEEFTYTVMDAEGETATATVTVAVNSINDPPTANDDAFPADLLPYDEDRDGPVDPRLLLVEDSTEEVLLFVIGNDAVAPDDDFAVMITDVASSTSTVRIATELASTRVGYIPGPNVSGDDTFTYTITDDGTPPLSDTGTVTVTVARVNDAPTAVDDTIPVAFGNATTIPAADVLDNDSAGPLESDQNLSIVSITSASQGTAVLNPDGSITYTPDIDAVGTDTIEYTIRDNGVTDQFDEADPNIITPMDDPLEATGSITFSIFDGEVPVAVDDTASIVSGSEPILIDVLQNDRDDGPASGLSIESFTQGEQGGTVTTEEGGLSYLPSGSFFGVDTFTYTVTDGEFSDTATVSVTVVDPNAAISVFAGVVYLDSNNDGEQGEGEPGIAGVKINLTGMDDDGNVVVREAITGDDGSYRFEELPRGTFTISEEQPVFLLDGVETPAEDSVSDGNDSFTLTVGASAVISEGNRFAERGLAPQFAMLNAFSSSRHTEGFLAAIDGPQSQLLNTPSGWDEFSSIRLAIADDTSEVTITVTDSASQQFQATLATSDRSKIQLIGRDHDTASVLLRIVADAAAFDFQPVEDSESAVASSAVDAVFAGA